MASLVGRSFSLVSRKRWTLLKPTVCWYTQQPPKPPTKSTGTQASPIQKQPPKAVTKSAGTQTSAVKAQEPVATDISTYKVPEYYGHNPMTYYDVDVNMSADRITQPTKFTAMPPKP